MAHNALIRGGVGSGLWTNHVLTGPEMELFDQRQFEGINGDQGGTWTPAAIVRIGGSGLAIATHLDFDTAAVLNYGSGCAVNGSPTWTGTIAFASSSGLTTGGITLAGGILQGAAGSHYTLAGVTSSFDFTGGAGLNATGGTWAISGAVINLTSSSNINLSGGSITVGAGQNINVNGNVNINGGATLSLNGSLAGTGQITGVFVKSGIGRFLDRIVDGVNADHTYAITDGDLILAPGLTAAHNYKITSAGAAEGDKITVSCNGSALFLLSIIRDDSSLITQLWDNVGASNFADLVFHSGQWKLARKGVT